MNDELVKYYENRFETMSTQGWIDLMDDVQKMIDSTDTLQGIDDINKLQFRKGELSIMNWLITLKQVSEQAYEGLKNEGN
jgi:hypothetical protein